MEKSRQQAADEVIGKRILTAGERERARCLGAFLSCGKLL